MCNRHRAAVAFCLPGLLAAAGLLAACGSKSPTAPSGPTVTSIKVSGSNSLNAGSTGTMTATATESDGSTRDVTATATWQSSNTAVVIVSSAGQVKGVAPGTSVISATFQGQTGQISVQVLAVDNIQVVTVALQTLVVDGTCDNDSILETPQDGEFAFSFEIERSGTGRTAIWQVGKTSYTKGDHAVSNSITFDRDVTKGEDFLLSFTGTEYDGVLGADTKFNGVFANRSYTYDGSNWIPSSRSLSISGGKPQCGATMKFAITSHQR